MQVVFHFISGYYNNADILLAWNMEDNKYFLNSLISCGGAAFIRGRRYEYLIIASILMMFVACLRVYKLK